MGRAHGRILAASASQFSPTHSPDRTRSSTAISGVTHRPNRPPHAHRAQNRKGVRGLLGARA